MFVTKKKYNSLLELHLELDKKYSRDRNLYNSTIEENTENYNDSIDKLSNNYKESLTVVNEENSKLLKDNNDLLETLAIALEELEKPSKSRDRVLTPKRRIAKVSVGSVQPTKVKYKSMDQGSDGIKFLEDFLKKHTSNFSGNGGVTVIENGQQKMVSLKKRSDIEKVVKDAKAGLLEIVV